ncbi:MAG: hypothetical protein UDC79_03495 [Acutalibacteraceae bacterium]|nr:hypothetical protein [Oscillospiraceae bacterium]MEE0443244.1 hypothetical protein [Acutalibacteraceae bacterium]
MKEYIGRIKSNCKTWEIVFWWIFRALMIYAFIAGFFRKPFDISDPLQVGANFIAMFAWEIFMLFPEKCFVRHMPSLIQDFSIVMIFAASFCGKFLNFYYDSRFWDSGMHLLSGGLCVLLGYEVVVAMQKRDNKPVSIPVALLCALCFSFFVSTCWELVEFTMDQVMTNPEKGTIGDAQHWCYELAKGTSKESTIFDPKNIERWPIMDTMGDIILNSIGAVAAWIFLKIFPYHHGKKYDVNKEIEEKSEKQKELMTK